MEKWLDLKHRISEETKRIWLQEPDELKIQRLGLLKNKAGSYGQYFGTWDFANGMMRDLSMYTMYPLFKLFISDKYSLDQMKDMYTQIVPVYTEYLRYSGYPTLGKYCTEFRKIMPDITDKEQFLEVYKALLMYSNKLAAWVYHYAPWEMGVVYRQKNEEWVKEAARLLSVQD
ncbi:MAG TPA: hypothetical protein PLI88_01640 [Bacillota bacterium]|nr:hypothetical protein [Bacillota bacterium]HOH09553.1 hypothetical protein [Bacillota bacterium]HOY89244.1 hypothetical protein [Bacillota bacterium]HPI00836.1 hypothetical protein [Bacillota bacterium]HPM63445.1 hypothetical protein [Bacillota bacterium]